eukprot:COSAG01_NODE_3775_length_5710_cov_6.461059_3_plen_113_part_00
METLQALSMAGHTVVASIHQPRSSIYQMCDTVCLLAEGRCCYFGPAGSPCHSHFAQVGTASWSRVCVRVAFVRHSRQSRWMCARARGCGCVCVRSWDILCRQISTPQTSCWT